MSSAERSKFYNFPPNVAGGATLCDQMLWVQKSSSSSLTTRVGLPSNSIGWGWWGFWRRIVWLMMASQTASQKYKKQCWQESKGVWGLRRVDQWPQSMAFKVKKVPFRKPTLAKLSPTCICSFVRVPSVEISATSSDILVFNQINWPWRNQTTFYGFYIFFSLIISQWYL